MLVAGVRFAPAITEKRTGTELVPVVTLPNARVFGEAVTLAGGALITTE